MKLFEYTVVLLLALMGIVNIIKSVILTLCRENNCRCDILLRIDDSCENPESAIRNTVIYHEWADKKNVLFSDIYCLYKGSNEENKAICQRVCEDYSSVHYIDS